MVLIPVLPSLKYFAIATLFFTLPAIGRSLQCCLLLLHICFLLCIVLFAITQPYHMPPDCTFRAWCLQHISSQIMHLLYPKICCLLLLRAVKFHCLLSELRAVPAVYPGCCPQLLSMLCAPFDACVRCMFLLELPFTLVTVFR